MDTTLDIVNGYGLVIGKENIEGNKTTVHAHPIFGWVTISLAWFPALFYAIIFFCAFYKVEDVVHRRVTIIAVTLLILPLAPIVPMTAAIYKMARISNEQTIYMTEFFVLVEASWEASLQVIWQGLIVISDQVKENSTIVIEGAYGNNKLELKQQTITYMSLIWSILVLSTSSLLCFVDGVSQLVKRKNISLVLLILSSQAFRTLTLTLILTYLNWFSAPVFMAILISNFFVLSKSETFSRDGTINYPHLIVNTLLNIPMICIFTKDKGTPTEGSETDNGDEKAEESVPLKGAGDVTAEIAGNLKHSDDDNRFNNNSTTSPESGPHTCNEEPSRNLMVEMNMIKYTNIILAISAIILTVLIYTKLWKVDGDSMFTKNGETTIFNGVSFYLWRSQQV